MASRSPSTAAPSSFGARLRRIRRARGLTLEELGDKVGLSKRMMSYYEVQGGTPSAPLLTKLSQALGVPLDELAGVRAPDTATDTPMTAVELRLWRKVRELQRLPDKDRRAVLQLIDTLLAKQAG